MLPPPTHLNLPGSRDGVEAGSGCHGDRRGSSWESMRRMWAERLGTEARRGVNWGWPERAPNPGIGWRIHKGDSKQCPLPTLGPLLAHS